MNQATPRTLKTGLLAGLCLLLLPWHALGQQTKYNYIRHKQTGLALQDDGDGSFSAASANSNNLAQVWAVTIYKEGGTEYVSLASRGPKGYRIGFTGATSMVGFTTEGNNKQFQFERRWSGSGYVLISRLYPTLALHVDRQNGNRLSLQRFEGSSEPFLWTMTDGPAPAPSYTAPQPAQFARASQVQSQVYSGTMMLHPNSGDNQVVYSPNTNPSSLDDTKVGMVAQSVAQNSGWNQQLYQWRVESAGPYNNTPAFRFGHIASAGYLGQSYAADHLLALNVKDDGGCVWYIERPLGGLGEGSDPKGPFLLRHAVSNMYLVNVNGNQMELRPRPQEFTHEFLWRLK